jgi:hypothetical protein
MDVEILPPEPTNVINLGPQRTELAIERYKYLK